jgi:hypothetical protein
MLENKRQGKKGRRRKETGRRGKMREKRIII